METRASRFCFARERYHPTTDSTEHRNAIETLPVFFSRGLDSRDFIQKPPSKVFNPHTLTIKCLTIKPLKPAPERLRQRTRRPRIQAPSARQPRHPLRLLKMVTAVSTPLHRDPATWRSIALGVQTELNRFHRCFLNNLNPVIPSEDFGPSRRTPITAGSLHSPLNDIVLSRGESVTTTTIGSLRKYMFQSVMADRRAPHRKGYEHQPSAAPY